MKIMIVIIVWLLYSSLSLAGETDFVKNKRELCQEMVLSDISYISALSATDYDIKILSTTSYKYIGCALYHYNHEANELFRDAATLLDQLTVHLEMDESPQINAMSIENIKLELLLKLDDLSESMKKL